MTATDADRDRMWPNGWLFHKDCPDSPSGEGCYHSTEYHERPTGDDEGFGIDPDVERLEGRVTDLVEAVLDIDAHATPLGEDGDGFVSGGYLVTVGALHRALGVLGHTAPKCKRCATLQAEGHPGCDEMRYEVGIEWTRNALESIATALGLPIEADYGAKSDGILLDDILGHIGSNGDQS